MAPGSPSSDKKTNWFGLANLFIVYVVWGSTYLAIRVAVREGSGFPPLFMAGTRVVTAGIILLIIAAIQKSRIRLTRQEYLRLFISGAVLWLGGNGLVVIAEQHVDSSIAALIIGSTPLVVASMEFVLDRKAPSGLMIVSMLTGFAGVGLLSAPAFLNGVRAEGLYVLLIVLASALWGAGSLYLSRNPVKVDPAISSGYQHLAGAVVLLTAALIAREPLPHPAAQEFLAWGYLVVFGSLLAFTSYIRALHLLPTNLVMTYAYVNPVIAVILGRLILKEEITAWTLGGMALILLGVAGVFRARYLSNRK